VHVTVRRRRLLAGAVAVAAAVAVPSAAQGMTDTVGRGGGTPGTAANFQLIGHNPLFNRGMNAAPAIYRNYIYVGNRTDSSDGHTNPGVLIASIADPAHPKVVGAIGRPEEANRGVSSRELRVWSRQKLLIVMNFRCSSFIHDCPVGTDEQFEFNLKFYDLTDPVHPRLIKTFVPKSRAGVPVKPHEMYLWIDPDNRDRALLYLSTPTLSTKPVDPNLVVEDISAASRGVVRFVTQFNANAFYPGAADPARYDFNLFTHSMSLNPVGNRLYLSQEAGEFLVADSSEVARGLQNPRIHLLTDPRDRPRWRNPNAHSAVPIPGRPLVLSTDEVYGSLLGPSQGCPWGWARLFNVAEPAEPRFASQYRIAENVRSFCKTRAGRDDEFVSYASHNPTVLHDLALIAWHSGGLQAIDISNPNVPQQGGWFSPVPLRRVATEDPALSAGPNKVVMWSYPIIRDGLIYVVDVRNGLYVLRYTGPQHGAVDRTKFLEGNSNRGDPINDN